jgi:LPXTG-motif cell wall-anchored protein
MGGLRLGSAAAIVLGVVLGVALTSTFPSSAGAADSWSTVGSGLPGTTINVSSGSDACDWNQPSATDAAQMIHFDDSSVSLGLEGSGTSTSLGTIAVDSGGAWQGSVTIPIVAPGDYDLVARCTVDAPALDSARSFEFAHRSFRVTDNDPPPTTTAAPPEIGSAITITAPPTTAAPPVQLGGGATLVLPDTGPSTTDPRPSLPNTGRATLPLTFLGLGALLSGAAALWWAGRRGSPESAHAVIPVRASCTERGRATPTE